MFAGNADNVRRDKTSGVEGEPHAQINGCVICGSGQNGDNILLCDGCDGEYHTYCLVPPLCEIPAGDFYCKKCMDVNLTKQHEVAADTSVTTPDTRAEASNSPLVLPLESSASAATTTPIKSSTLMKESKYRGVSRVSMKGVKKPFVAKLWQGSKYLQLGTFSSEIEAAHAYDKAALMHYGKSAQLNFPHLHDSFARPEVAFSFRQQNSSAATEMNATSSPGRPSSTDYYASPGHGQSKCRGRGRGRGRGKRLQEFPDLRVTDANSEAKRRKMKSSRSMVGSCNQKVLSVPVKKYLGVQVHRVYAHAQIQVNGKVVNLGTFPTAEDAAIAYDKAALKYFGDSTGFSDAHSNEIVLNFPEKRNVLLKQLLDEGKQKASRQASVVESSYASRSAQNAKYKLSIMKLNAWLSKLQRSVKMVEASQRVQWGLHLVSGRMDEEENSKEEDNVTGISSLVKMDFFGSGPTIKKEFTTRDQKLRQNSKEIQKAILLVIEELKIHAANVSVDPLFQPPLQCPPILNLLSTSRHLKLVNAINDLAHLKDSVHGKDPNSIVSGCFEKKLRAVVDYRARLQMSSNNDKQKLAHLFRDVKTGSSPSLDSTSARMDDGDSIPANAELRLYTLREPGYSRTAKYVKRKVLVCKPAMPNNGRQNDPSEHVVDANEEMKKEFVDSSGEAKFVTVADVEMEAANSEDKVEKIIESSDCSRSAEASKDKAVFAPETADKDTRLENNSDRERLGIDAVSVLPDVDMNGFTGKEASKDEDLYKMRVGENRTEEERKEDKPETIKFEKLSGTEQLNQNKTEVTNSSDEIERGKFEDKPDIECVGQRVGNYTKEDEHHKDPLSESKAACFEDKPVTVKLGDDSIRGSVDDISTLSTIAVPGDKFEWEFCLAAPTVVKDKWRLLPLSSNTSEFSGDLFFTEKEVLKFEISEEEVCSSSATDGKTAWMEHLRQLYVEESKVRQNIQRESNCQYALDGVMRIEQDRLHEISNVYREAMAKLDMETSLALKSYKRASEDAQLVKLMQHSFNPILSNLLDKCEEALLNCFQKLSLRFEDFAQEFEYYRISLLRLTQPQGKDFVTEDEHASLIVAADLNVDDNSVVIKRENIDRGCAATILNAPKVLEIVDDSEAVFTEESDMFDDLSDSPSLRQAYIAFYMAEMEALWKERSSSLEMVQAIQRSLLNDTTGIASAEEATLLIETLSSFEALRSTASETKVRDLDCERTTKVPIAIAIKTECTSETGPYIAEGKATESRDEAEKGFIDDHMQMVGARMPTGNTSDLVRQVEKTPKIESAELVLREVSGKTKPQLGFGKFRREQELRDAVESCLAQWQRIQWPKELNSTFLTPTSVALPGQFSKVTSEQTTLSSSTVTDDENTENDSPYSVMEELKRMMIDLTQEQAIPVSPPAKPTTLVMYHPVFMNHQTPKNHPECPERMDRVVNIVKSLVKKHHETLTLDRLSMSPEELCPPETTLLMVHSPTYLRQLKERSIEAGSQSVSFPATSSSSSRALVFESDSGIREEAPKRGSKKNNGRPPLVGAFGAASLEQNGVELDTFVSSKSWDVARAAAGTVCLAVDRVVRREYHNAVCLVRPPGHHVGRHGRTENAPSSGFCLLNNVVIGATHARLYPWVRKVAVLDWDIHHGNGTEELLKDDPDAFFASIHLYSSGKYFPGTGKSCETGNRVNVALENTGAGSGSQAFRSALVLKVLPAMRAFRPDIIFISAGFDGHRDDILGGVAAVNNPNVPAGYVEEDFAWATLEALKLAAEVCDGRVVSVLEGGYDVHPDTNSLAKSVAAHVAAISAYETGLRKTGDNFIANLEMKTGGAVDVIDVAAASLDASSIKTKHFIKKERMSLLEKLLSADVTDESVIIIDDEEENEEEIRGEGNHEVHDDVDIGYEEDTGEEEEEDYDVGMEEAQLEEPLILYGNRR